MKNLKALLVATDFSENAHQAVDEAIALAKGSGARIEVVHAFQTPVPIVSPYEVVVPDGFLEQARNAAAKNLRAVVEKISAEGIAVKSHLTEVPAAPAIARLAEELGVDLIVIGTRGNTGLKHVLLGSVAERTLRLAPCSVLTVKHRDS
jgi:nucleotide-binding universal stress UspA family protein